MSLYKQLSIVLLGLCLSAMAATFWINFANTQSFLINQMQIQTEDSATALGFSLQPELAERDISGIETTVNAVFDRGFYSQIRVEDADGVVLFSKQQPVLIEGVPSWFSNLFQFDPPVSHRELSAGWALGGLLTVAGHPGYAYQQLWETLWSSIKWYTLGAMALLAIAYFCLANLLSPLNAIVTQAQGIILRKFADPLPLPKTTELNTVVSAMNRMTENVKLTFQEQNKTAKHLRELAYQDPLTRLGNRRYLEAQLSSALNEKEQFCPLTLFLIQIHDFKGFNERNGYQRGDEALLAIAEIIGETFGASNDSILARLTGGDFVVCIKLQSNEYIDALAEKLCLQIADLHNKQIFDDRHVANIGVVNICETQPLGSVMSQADAALRQAQAKGRNFAYRASHQSHSEAKNTLGRTDWKAHIKNLITDKSFVLLRQKIVAATNTSEVMHWESFVQLKDIDGTLISAGEFFLVAERMGLSEEIDRWVISELVRNFAESESRISIAMNLSSDSLKNPKFHAWLIKQLSAISSKSKLRLILEISENIATSHLDIAKKLANDLHVSGHGIAIDRFGRGFSDFGYLKSLQPIYVKMDPFYAAQAMSNKDSQFFITCIQGICRSLDIELIAQNVETEEQQKFYTSIQVDGVQGFALGSADPV